MLEGYLTSCTFDYMTDNLETKMFVFILWVWCWVFPLIVIVFCYGKITAEVMSHEAKLKEQVSDSLAVQITVKTSFENRPRK